MPEALIFDIQRGSFVDGPGIRTVVFFKGCNLRCQWCHNPESWENKPQLAFFASRCINCGSCLNLCPVGAVKPDYHVDMHLCTTCGLCINACPNGARRIYGKRMDTEKIFMELTADLPFYEASSGGITLSGGECLLQLAAVKDLLQRCHFTGIHTAVDTAGNVPWEHIEEIYELTDLFLYDIKCITPSLHLRLTGASNKSILRNYISLWHLNPSKIHVRIPVIPGYNDTSGEMDRIHMLLSRYPPAKVDLLPYHSLGESKASALNYIVFHAAVPTEERMEYLQQMFRPAQQF